MITTEDLLKKTGISYPTLIRLKDLGIIPKPSRQGRGNRRGVIGVFPEEVIETIKWVRAEQESGSSLTEIAENWRVIRAMDDFVELASKYPGYRIVRGKISERGGKGSDTVVVEVELKKVKRR